MNNADIKFMDIMKYLLQSFHAKIEITHTHKKNNLEKNLKHKSFITLSKLTQYFKFLDQIL